MLTSLFGDLPPHRLPATSGGHSDAAASGSEAAGGVATRNSHHTDVVVEGSPTDTIRAHFASHRQDLRRATAMVTLLDPSRLWAPQVLQALAAAGGQPVQRLNLRERSTLRTLAVIERTLVPRRDATPLRVYNADIRGGAAASGVAPEEIPCALAEASQLTAVIVGAMQPHALVALLRSLVLASQRPAWRCPQLVFMLPPGAAALRQRILAQDWPAGLTVHALAEPMGSAASLWNRVLEAWETTQAGTGATTGTCAATGITGTGTTSGSAGGSAGMAQPALPRRGMSAPPATAPGGPGTAGAPGASGTSVADTSNGLPPVLMNRLLLPLARSEGLLACGIVDLDNGDLLASQQRDQPSTDLAALAEAMCAARLAHQAVGPAEGAPDELLVTTGARQTLLRRLPGEAALGFMAVLDRQQANLTLLRFKLLDAERILA